MRQASDQIMKLSLEFGGNAPFVVFDDADVDGAVEGAIQSKFRNGRQTCVCANRLHVQAGVYDAFAAKFSDRVNALKVGDGFEPGVDIGSMIDRRAVAKVMTHVEDATQHGGRITTGGRTLERGPLFLAPTVVADATSEMLFAREETLGPFAPLFRFETFEDVIRLANETVFGLASYFYTRDISCDWRVAEALEYGMIGIKTGLISTELAPFGGVKQSGVGREGSRYGLEDFTEMKYILPWVHLEMNYQVLYLRHDQQGS
jgi:succinate-semialdehyde dehydrogenase / glutarate-semialdehyde dehydrogenase